MHVCCGSRSCWTMQARRARQVTFGDGWRSLAASPTAAIWRRVRGANYVIAPGWRRTMLARRSTMVDDDQPSDFSNIFLTALYVHVELWSYVFQLLALSITPISGHCATTMGPDHRRRRPPRLHSLAWPMAADEDGGYFLLTFWTVWQPLTWCIIRPCIQCTSSAASMAGAAGVWHWAQTIASAHIYVHNIVISKRFIHIKSNFCFQFPRMVLYNTIIQNVFYNSLLDNSWIASSRTSQLAD